MSDHDIDTEYLEQLAANRRKKILYGIGGAIVAAGVMVWGASTMFQGSDAVIDFMTSGGQDQAEEIVIEPLPLPERRAINVTTEPPGAAVIVNGVPSQRITPASIDIVADARNTLTFYHDGYRTEHVTIDADQADLSVSLTPWEAPPRPPNYQPPKDEAGNPLPEEPVHGRIRVITRSAEGPVDNATIWHNGELVSEPTPATIHVQTGEDQHILVRRGGYLDAIAFVRAIPYGQETDMRELPLELQVDRDNAFSAISLRTFPRDAKAWIDDQEITGNLITPVARNRHFMLRVEAPGHETWEQAFDATVGSIQLSVQLPRPVAELGTLTIAGLPEGTDAYLIPQREGATGGTQIGNRGHTQLQEVESGAYTLRISWGPYNQRERKDFDIEVVANEHRHITLQGAESAIEIASTTSRRP